MKPVKIIFFSVMGILWCHSCSIDKDSIEYLLLPQMFLELNECLLQNLFLWYQVF